LFFAYYTDTSVDGTIPPNDPDNDDGDDDDECSTVTASSCTQLCSGSSCTQSCHTVVGCSKTDTDLASTVTPAPVISGGENWPYLPTDTQSELEAAATVEANLISSGYISPNNAPIQSTTFGTGEGSGGGGGGGASGATTVSTITVVKTQTITTVTPISTIVGFLRVSGVKTEYDPPRGGSVEEISYYNLNYQPATTTLDICTAGFYNVQGD
jgi:hypothetical protein